MLSLSSTIGGLEDKEGGDSRNIDTIKFTIITKFKEILWCNNEIKNKRKLIQCKEINNSKLEEEKYMSIISM